LFRDDGPAEGRDEKRVDDVHHRRVGEISWSDVAAFRWK
jgi:hypothetical protein